MTLALDALLSGSPVETPEGRGALVEREFSLRNPRQLFYRNSAGVPNNLFESRGFKPYSADSERIFEQSGAIISAGFTRRGHNVRHLQFDYTFGNVGAQGYEIRIYKSILRKRIVFVHAWIS